MSKAIMCDRCGRFESINDFQEWTKNQKYFLAKGLGSYCVDLCSKCSAELEKWYEDGKLIYLNSQKTDPLEAFKVYEKNEKPKEIKPEEEKPVDSNFGVIDNDLPVELSMSEPDEEEVIDINNLEPIPVVEVKPVTNEKKPRSTTNIKWDEYMVDKLFGLLRNGKTHEEAAEYLGTTLYSVQNILSKIRNGKSGDNYYPYRRKYSWYFEKRVYKQWDNESIIIVLEDIKRLGSVAAAARENNLNESSVYMILNRVKASRNNPNHKYYPIYIQYANILEFRVDSNPVPKNKDGVWTEERIKEALDLRTKYFHSWNTVAEIMGLTQKDIRSLVQGISGSNGRIYRIAKEYGYGE